MTWFRKQSDSATFIMHGASADLTWWTSDCLKTNSFSWVLVSNKVCFDGSPYEICWAIWWKQRFPLAWCFFPPECCRIRSLTRFATQKFESEEAICSKLQLFPAACWDFLAIVVVAVEARNYKNLFFGMILFYYLLFNIYLWLI